MSDGMSSVAQNAVRVMPERYVGAIVAGLDVHLRQITFDCLDAATGEVTRGRIAATPAAVEGWVAQFPGREGHAAMEACTGWLFVVRALERAGAVAHLAETVETRALRGRSRRAKTDRQDALWLRELLAEGRLPEAWIAPEHIRQWRSKLHLRKALIDERTQWLLRIRSSLFHHGLSQGAPAEMSSAGGREFLARLELPADAVQRIETALFMIDTLDRQIHALDRELRKVARHQAGCQALMTQFRGRGADRPGDLDRARRRAAHVFLAQSGAVCRDRYRRAPLRSNSAVGKLTRQGSPTLRWALYEAAQSATRPQSPDYADYHALKARGLTHTRASLTIAGKIARRSYHLLHALGPAALEPVA